MGLKINTGKNKYASLLTAHRKPLNLLKNAVFWDVTSLDSYKSRRFGGKKE
jgi:hypothetical protein